MFSPHFDVFCDLLLNRRTATWNLFVYIITKQTNTDKAFFKFKIFQYNPKAGLRPLWRTRKKPFDVDWLLCVAKNCDWSRKITPLRRMPIVLVTLTQASLLVDWKLTAKAVYWIAKSSNFHFLSSEQPCEPKSLDVALKIAGVEKIRSGNLRLRSTWRPFDSSFEWKERYWWWKFASSVVGDSQISLV